MAVLTGGKVSAAAAPALTEQNRTEKVPKKKKIPQHRQRSPGSHCVEISGRFSNDELLQRQVNQCPQHQNKHTHQHCCRTFPQQVEPHFGLPLLVTAAVAVIPALLVGAVVILRSTTVRSERLYSPDGGVELHL